jgi:hypothetical protein
MEVGARVIMTTRQERAALRSLVQAAVLFRQCRKLHDSGDLVMAREVLCDYVFALIDAKDVLRQSEPTPVGRQLGPLLDAVNQCIRTGLNYMTYLDEGIKEETQPMSDIMNAIVAVAFTLGALYWALVSPMLILRRSIPTSRRTYASCTTTASPYPTNSRRSQSAMTYAICWPVAAPKRWP